MASVWFMRTIFRKGRRLGRARQDLLTDPAWWGDKPSGKKIPIMVWVQTQWKQPILGRVVAELSPAGESTARPRGRRARRRGGALFGNGTPNVVAGLLDNNDRAQRQHENENRNLVACRPPQASRHEWSSIIGCHVECPAVRGRGLARSETVLVMAEEPMVQSVLARILRQWVTAFCASRTSPRHSSGSNWAAY